MLEQVILVNEADQEIGFMEKMEAHEKAVLHRAFSVFILNDAGEMLLQQRASNKYHSANLWTNTCCSHPKPGELTKSAAHRRLQEEMGFDTPLEKAFDFILKRFSFFSYRLYSLSNLKSKYSFCFFGISIENIAALSI